LGGYKFEGGARQMKIEVSDLYDSLYEIAKSCWDNFEFEHTPDDFYREFNGEWDTIVRALEVDLFFAACARRLMKLTGVRLSTADVEDMLRLCDNEGNMLEGMAAEYHMNGFDWSLPGNVGNEIENLVIGGDGTPRYRSDARLFLVVPGAAQQGDEPGAQ
jgi:hypothetical protein